ncbi:penicillin-binding protein 2 [Alcanivorax sp. 1008]|nr:penicillin-binding protein 2 [Alcanivorax sp. 1008]
MRLRDRQRESQIIQMRLVWTLVFVVIVLAALVSRIVWLQWAQHDRFRALADQNRVQTQPIAPPRGLILDRHGRILADNQPDFSLVVIPEQLRDMEAALSGLRELIDIDEDQLERFRAQLSQRRRPWEPVPLRSRLTAEEIALVAEARHEWPGVRIEAEAIRHYPYGELFSHVIGYVNRINAQDISAMDEATLANYSGTNFYGRAGIERQYESILHGTVGYRKAETNARGRVQQVLDETPPIAGEDISLFLDLDVQRAGWNALGGRRGAAIAIDPRDGGVLAFISRPGFDPNLFVTGISLSDYGAYREDPDRPLFNRALQGQYPPGSTIKSMMGLAALEAGVTDWQRTIQDPGFFRLPGTERVFRDWKRGGHGKVDLHKAIVESCDTYFYDASLKMGIDHMSDFLSYFNLGRRTGIDLQGELAGILPSREWKQSARRSSWFHGDTVNTSIGQGYMLTTPLQLAQAMAISARRGKQHPPQVAMAATATTEDKDLILKDPNNWQLMEAALTDVIHGAHGTARAAGRGAKYKIAGKTGTAQVFSLASDVEYKDLDVSERLRDHALFVAFAPADNPAIAVAVLVENGESGGRAAAPVARAIMDAWLLDGKGNLRDLSKPRLSSTGGGESP